jgi:hypothetical protein
MDEAEDIDVNRGRKKAKVLNSRRKASSKLGKAKKKKSSTKLTRSKKIQNMFKSVKRIPRKSKKPTQ